MYHGGIYVSCILPQTSVQEDFKMADSNKNSRYVRAAYAPDASGAEQMIAVLKQYDIEAFRQGGVKDIYKIGGDICGEEIMVSPEDLSAAQDILCRMTGDTSPSPKRSVSVKTTVLSLLAAAALLIVLLLLRGKLL